MLLTACTPAAETSEHMYTTAAHVSDSIIHNLDSALMAPAKEVGLIKPEAQIASGNFVPAVKK